MRLAPGSVTVPVWQLAAPLVMLAALVILARRFPGSGGGKRRASQRRGLECPEIKSVFWGALVPIGNRGVTELTGI